VPNVGYARVSTSEQDLALQKDALKKSAAREYSPTTLQAPRPIGQG
jgi:DNA invertase Pin-like site-specific DNA recombinase